MSLFGARFFGVAVLVAGFFLAGVVNAQEGKEGKDRARGERSAEQLKKYDANKDGKLDDAERAKMREEFVARLTTGEPPAFLLQRYDADKDGKLNDAEKAKMIEAVKSGEGLGGRGQGGRGGEEFQKKQLERYDANKDGKLDEAEMAKAREDRQKNRPEGGKKRRPNADAK